MSAKKTVQPFISLQKRTITKDLTISLVSMVVLVSAIAIFSNYFYNSHLEEKRLDKLADEYKTYLIESLELPIWTLDRKISSKIAESYFNNELVEMITVTEKFYDANRFPSDKTVFNKAKAGASDLIIRDFQIRHNGRVIGNVKFGLTRRLYKSTLQKHLMSNVFILALIILSVVIVTVIFLRLLVKKPLYSLVEGINQISRGNYEYEFIKFKQMEIQSIISDFKFMANQVKGREQSLADMNNQLAFEVKARKKIEKAIRDNEAQLMAIFEASADGILVLDSKGFIINANNRFYKMWRIPGDYRLRETQGILTEYILKQIKNPKTLKINKIHQADKEDFEEIYLKDDRVFECIYFPLIRSDKNTGTVIHFRDISDRKKSVLALRESEDRFRQLSDAALEAIIIHDNGIVIQANDQFLNMFGYSRKEVLGILPFIRIIDPKHSDVIIKNIISSQLTFLEVDGLRKDGSSFPVIIRSKEMTLPLRYFVMSQTEKQLKLNLSP